MNYTYFNDQWSRLNKSRAFYIYEGGLSDDFTDRLIYKYVSTSELDDSGIENEPKVKDVSRDDFLKIIGG
jgi:hypothetical protein